MLELFFSPTFFNAVHQTVNEIVRIATIFLTLGVVVYFISMVFRLSTKEGDDTTYRLFVVVFSAIGLATYRFWAVWIGKLFVLLARAIFDLEGGNIMTEYLGAFFANEDGSGLRLSVFNLMSLETLSSLSYLLVMIVYEIFVIIQVIVQIFFYLLGPVAIVLSLFPTFYDIFKIWLANFCAVNFWSVLAAILFRLVKTLTASTAFQTAVQNGDKGVLWDSFILGVIISISLILIPKVSAGIFKLASASADLGTYGTGITAGVVVTTVWKRLKAYTTNVTHNVSSTTANTVISGARALSASPVAATTTTVAESIARAETPIATWPFGGSAQVATSVNDLRM
ncbi:MAG: hypothetical protein ONB44_13985 [candidate division KSB1 bacterium]|nr:hypothetical protein [candidate division KSB1 bacterium]MDZ7303234.1 hypothetical protein [candidate division KSB1 bacterium]MDZ7312154.1 hypothetical protein [candidate division KSB1 bacterium]